MNHIWVFAAQNQNVAVNFVKMWLLLKVAQKTRSDLKYILGAFTIGFYSLFSSQIKIWSPLTHVRVKGGHKLLVNDPSPVCCCSSGDKPFHHLISILSLEWYSWLDRQVKPVSCPGGGKRNEKKHDLGLYRPLLILCTGIWPIQKSFLEWRWGGC